jgi:small-conductance mechanosensitive channel
MLIAKFIGLVFITAIAVDIAIATDLPVHIFVWLSMLVALGWVFCFVKPVQSFITWLSSLLYKWRVGRDKPLKEVRFLSILARTVFNRISIFAYITSWLLWHFSKNPDYFWIIPAYLLPSVLLLVLIKFSDSFTDNFFQEKENLYFEFSFAFILILTHFYIGGNILDEYQNKMIPDVVIETYAPTSTQLKLNRSNRFHSIPNMEIYSEDQFQKINFTRYVNTPCLGNDCVLTVINTKNSVDPLEVSSGNQSSHKLQDLFGDTNKENPKSLKQYFSLKIGNDESNIFWIESHITKKEYWVLFTVTLSMVLVLLGSLIKIILIYNARREGLGIDKYAEKIYEIFKYANTYHGFHENDDDEGEERKTKIDEIFVTYKLDNTQGFFKKHSTKEKLDSIQKIKDFLLEDNPDKSELKFVDELDKTQDICLSKYVEFSKDYIEQNLLPHSKIHRQKTEVDFRACDPDAERINHSLHAGSLVDIEPHARLIQFVIDAIITVIITYVLIVLYTHQWLPTEAAVVSSLAAAIMYLNRDWLHNLISGYVIWRDELISLGEWISIPEENINGHIFDITQSNFKIANYSGTEVSMPIHEIINRPFHSYKKAKEQGHRIKRSLLIDIRSVKKLKSSKIIDKDIRGKVLEAYDFKPGGEVEKENLSMFRKYITEYLLDMPYINNNALLMVRELDLTEYGVPLEIYAFVEPLLAVYQGDTNYSNCIKHYDRAVYEAIQSEIMEHVICTAPIFGLRIFQSESDRQDEGVDTLDKQ